MIILVTNNFLFCKMVTKLVTIVTNNFWSLNLVTNKIFYCNVSLVWSYMLRIDNISNINHHYSLDKCDL